MINAIDELKELGAQIRIVAALCNQDISSEVRNVAVSLESLIPEMEAEIADIHHSYQTGEAYERLVSVQVDALTAKYRAEIAALNDQFLAECNKVRGLEAEITEFKAQQTEYEKDVHEAQTDCSHERLSVVAALREAAQIVEPNPDEHSELVASASRAHMILALIPPADAKALDAHDAEVRKQVLEEFAQFIEANSGEFKLKDTRWVAAEARAFTKDRTLKGGSR